MSQPRSGFSGELWAAGAEPYAAVVAHPFLVELAAGTPPTAVTPGPCEHRT